MSEEPKLLPCPFCGSHALIEQYGERWSVGCSESGEVMPGTAECIGYISLTTFARKADAVAAWNRRVIEPPAPEDDSLNLPWSEVENRLRGFAAVSTYRAENPTLWGSLKEFMRALRRVAT